MPKSNNQLRAVFDIRPVTEKGDLDISKISSVNPTINLAVAKVKRKVEKKVEWESFKDATGIPLKVYSEKPRSHLIAQDPEVVPRLAVKEEFDNLINEVDASLIVSLGGALHSSSSGKPRLRPILAKKTREVDLDHVARKILERDIVNEIGSAIPGMAEESPKVAQEKITKPEPVVASPVNIQAQPEISEVDLLISNFHKSGPPKSISVLDSKVWKVSLKKLSLLVAGIALLGWAAYSFGSSLKDKVTANGESAVVSLEAAEESLKNMDFHSASDNFLDAYNQFSQAGERINFMGASLGSLISDLPGAGKLKSANSLVEMGKLFADTGSAMARAMESLSGAASIFGGEGQTPNVVFASMTDALSVARANIEDANKLASNIDLKIIPEEKREEFASLLKSLPLFKKTVDQAFDYSKFLERMAGVYGSKRYLILFENQSELRPTGGFPGTYGVVTFQNGSLQDFKVDDIYNIDGQLKETIIPPVPMQHITPTWAMRDANWFIDFPTSARKIMEFYKKESGLDVDGVIVVNPELVSQVIDIVGPIELPQYKMTLNSSNFVPELQREVEYGPNRTQPKTVMIEFAKQLLEKVKSADSEKWPEIFAALSDGMSKKNTLMYFKDLYLERFAVDNNFAGQVIETEGDYQMVTFSNIKGSKGDRVTDTSFDLKTELKEGNIIHSLTITRKHNGGDDKLGFYNRPNPSYVRVLVPKGSQLLSISGNDQPSFQPLVSYKKSGFSTDPDLARLEDTFKNGTNGESVYEESGKTGFAFWMVNKPKETKTVTLTYSIPQNLVTKNYSLYIQKQPGLVVPNFDYSVFSTEAFGIKSSNPALSNSLSKYTLNTSLEQDLPLKIEFE